MKILVAPFAQRTGNKTALDAFYLQPLPDCALLREGWPFFVPDWADVFVARALWAVRINRLGKDIAPQFAHRYYEGVHMGVLFSSAEGMSCFDGSVALSAAMPSAETLSLAVDGQIVQRDTFADMPHSVDELIVHASRYLTLRTGDIILCSGGTTGACGGTTGLAEAPSAPTALGVAEGQTLTGFLDGQAVLNIRIK